MVLFCPGKWLDRGKMCGILLALVAWPLFALDIPLESDQWKVLGYRNIPVNEVMSSKAGMEIRIDGSASAIVYPIPEPGRFTTLHVKATIDGQVNLGDLLQGSKEGDDFRLRVGLVYAGDKTLNFIQRSLAPQWIRTLYDLAPEGAGISRVEFYNTWQSPQLAGQKRPHPTTKLWRENFVLSTSPRGAVNQVLRIPTDSEVVAIWLSADGDNTGSSFRVILHSLSLESAS